MPKPPLYCAHRICHCGFGVQVPQLFVLRVAWVSVRRTILVSVRRTASVFIRGAASALSLCCWVVCSSSCCRVFIHRAAVFVELKGCSSAELLECSSVKLPECSFVELLTVVPGQLSFCIASEVNCFDEATPTKMTFRKALTIGKVCLLRGRCDGACTPLSTRGLPALPNK